MKTKTPPKETTNGNRMVKLSITIPEDLYGYAEKVAGEIAKQTGMRVNVSEAFRKILREERARVEANGKAAR